MNRFELRLCSQINANRIAARAVRRHRPNLPVWPPNWSALCGSTRSWEVQLL